MKLLVNILPFTFFKIKLRRKKTLQTVGFVVDHTTDASPPRGRWKKHELKKYENEKKMCRSTSQNSDDFLMTKEPPTKCQRRCLCNDKLQ